MEGLLSTGPTPSSLYQYISLVNIHIHEKVSNITFSLITVDSGCHGVRKSKSQEVM